MEATYDAVIPSNAVDLQLRRELTYQEISRRLTEIDDRTGRRTRYYFAAIFIQENARCHAFSSREVERLWQRWVAEH